MIKAERDVIRLRKLPLYVLGRGTQGQCNSETTADGYDA
jgi:hypothetical protein